MQSEGNLESQRIGLSGQTHASRRGATYEQLSMGVLPVSVRHGFVSSEPSVLDRDTMRIVAQEEGLS
jgi:hypothetical protein